MSYYIASIYAALGDKEKAFVELEKAYEQRDWELHRLKVDPLLGALRDDPRFNDLLSRVGLPHNETPPAMQPCGFGGPHRNLFSTRQLLLGRDKMPSTLLTS